MHTILVVNDDVDMLNTYCMALERWGYRAVPAESSEEALEYLGKERPDLILTNVTRDRIDGWEFAAIVRSNPETEDIPIIVATGRPHTEEELKRYRRLMDVFIAIPVPPKELRDTIEEVLGRGSG